MRFVLYPYKMGSLSGRQISEGLNALRVYPDRNYRPRPTDFVINWGSVLQPRWYYQNFSRFLNRPENVALASDKVLTFQTLSEAGLPTVPWTTNYWTALEEFDNPIARTLTRASRGRGIIRLSEAQNAPSARLYTDLIPNYGEYRLHIVEGQIIAYTKKSRHHDDEPQTEDEEQIRTNENGWVFRRGNLRRLERIEDLALSTMEVLGLDFGAVDIIKDENRDVHVLEVNTAVGMTETTLEDYINAFRNIAYAA